MEKTQLLGRLISEVIPDQESRSIVDAIKLATETRKTQLIEYKIPDPSGAERWFEGRITLMEKSPDGYSKLVFVVNEISERVLLYKEIQRLANQDPLTNCFNRRHFMTLAEQELQRAVRYKRSLSLIFLDIDFFKKFNDQYGHQIGDQVLRCVVNLCQEQLRTVDIMGRYGGEEFVILMPETSTEGALQAAERIRGEIENMKVMTTSGELSVTVSIGITSLLFNSRKTPSLDDLIKRADQALYSAKLSGRNSVKAG
jgi:diguanylate cyclase (GGDEF)-like protein